MTPSIKWAVQFCTFWSRCICFRCSRYSSALPTSSLFVTNAYMTCSVAASGRYSLILEVLRRWNIADLHTAVTCDSIITYIWQGYPVETLKYSDFTTNWNSNLIKYMKTPHRHRKNIKTWQVHRVETLNIQILIQVSTLTYCKYGKNQYLVMKRVNAKKC